MTERLLRSTAVLILATIVTLAPVTPAYGQLQRGPDYSKGRSQFPNLLGPYFPTRVPAPELANSPRVEQLIREGKMELSLQDAIALALENNLDIAVQRYTPWIADTDILRAKGGGVTRGLAGTGTAQALGTIPSLSFDPEVNTTLALDHRNIPVNNPFLTGAGFGLAALTNHTTQANFSYSQAFHTGTGMAVTWNNSRTATTSLAALFNPSLQSTVFVSFSQQLLSGFGLLPNTRFIRIAKNSKNIADLVFAQQVITTVTEVQNLYWELVFAREDVRVKERSVALAEKLYNDNKRQVEIGTLAPIEVVRAEAEVARTRQDLIVAQTVHLQQQTLLKNALTKNPMDPALQTAEIIPTDAIVQPAQLDIPPLQDAVKEAWEKRPDVRQAKTDLLNRDINVRATRNALLPTLSLFGQYGWTGLAGHTIIPGAVIPNTFLAVQTSPVVDANGNPTGTFTSTPVRGPSQAFLDGLGESFQQIFDNRFPTYSLQLTLSIPIRNRPAQADNARAILEERQTETRLKQLENTIVVEVRNAGIAVEQNRARVEAAQKSRILQEQTLDAEQKKYQLGASTIFFVIQAQRDLAQAQSVEVRALADLLRAKIDLERALGRTLEVNRITIAAAKRGEIDRDTRIPGTIRGEIVGARQKY